MKRFKYKTIVYSIITIMLLCASCAPSSKVVIYGTSGTEIYDSEYKMLGTISNSGKIKIKLPKYEYVPFLLSHEVNSSLYIPFAVNFKYKNHTTENTMSVLGLFTGFGTFPSIIYICSRSSSQYENNYKYNKDQSTNQDCRFEPFLDNGEKRTIEPTSNVTPIMTNESVSTVARKKLSVSKRSLTDNAKFVSGTYTGSGYLAQKGKVIEEYADIRVVVLRIDNNTVNIDIVENEESYFSSKTKYQVNKKGKNTYVLSLEDIPDAFITIDNAGHLTYIHPKVNIDGDIYTLNITANKK